MNSPLKFDILTFTPAEVDLITGLTTAMQRDWRFRGFLQKSDGHARFDIFGVCQVYLLKLFADSKGPAATFPHVQRMAVAAAKTALMWHPNAWSGESPAAVFDQLSPSERGPTNAERHHAELLGLKRVNPSEYGWVHDRPSPPDKIQKIEWVIDTLFKRMGHDADTKHSCQVVWWATDEVEIGAVDGDQIRTDENPQLARPALLLDLTAAVNEMMSRLPHAFVSVEIEAVGEAGSIQRRQEANA